MSIYKLFRMNWENLTSKTSNYLTGVGSDGAFGMTGIEIGFV
jgi:hypothetical protein